MCAADLFSDKLAPPPPPPPPKKMREPCILFQHMVWGLQSLKRFRKTHCAALWRILSSIKMCRRKLRKSANRPTKNRGFRLIFVLSGLL
jgi:hypothetical protein